MSDKPKVVYFEMNSQRCRAVQPSDPAHSITIEHCVPDALGCESWRHMTSVREYEFGELFEAVITARPNPTATKADS